jgi:hypothetical protein
VLFLGLKLSGVSRVLLSRRCGVFGGDVFVTNSEKSLSGLCDEPPLSIDSTDHFITFAGLLKGCCRPTWQQGQVGLDDREQKGNYTFTTKASNYVVKPLIQLFAPTTIWVCV